MFTACKAQLCINRPYQVEYWVVYMDALQHKYSKSIILRQNATAARGMSAFLKLHCHKGRQVGLFVQTLCVIHTSVLAYGQGQAGRYIELHILSDHAPASRLHRGMIMVIMDELIGQWFGREGLTGPKHGRPQHIPW